MRSEQFHTWGPKRVAATRLGPWLALAVLASGACHNDDERVDDICGRVAACGQVRSIEDCGDRLRDALTDGRTTDEGAASCAVCVSDPENTCQSLLVTRDCDTACEGVDVVTDMYTSSSDRLVACDASKNICGIGDVQAVQACLTLITNQISTNPKLDRSLASCVACLRSVIVTAVTEGTSGCDATTCSNECSEFPTIQNLFKEDAAVRDVCNRVELCSGTNGSTEPTNTCLGAALAANQTVVASCSQCLNSTQACGDLFRAGGSGEAGAAGAAATAGVCDEVCVNLPGFPSVGH